MTLGLDAATENVIFHLYALRHAALHGCSHDGFFFKSILKSPSVFGRTVACCFNLLLFLWPVACTLLRERSFRFVHFKTYSSPRLSAWFGLHAAACMFGTCIRTYWTCTLPHTKPEPLQTCGVISVTGCSVTLHLCFLSPTPDFKGQTRDAQSCCCSISLT